MIAEWRPTLVEQV